MTTSPASRAPRPLVVTITGSESTGKTTLAARLAEAYGTRWAPEFVRGYAARKGAPLDASDVEPIARGQLALEERVVREAEAAGARLVFLDTDLVSTAVYARHYYGDVPAWVERTARARRAHLYLLCHADVPWVADPQRDRPHARDELHASFAAALAELVPLGAALADVRGGWAERDLAARRAVDALLGGEGTGRRE